MSALAFLLGLGGFAALALAMPKHYQSALRRASSRRMSLSLRVLGWLLIAASLLPSIAWLGNSVGIVAWFGVLNVVALLTALGLTLSARVPRQRR